MPSRGVQGGISWVGLEDTGVGVGVDSDVGSGIGVAVGVGVGTEVGKGVGVGRGVGVGSGAGEGVGSGVGSGVGMGVGVAVGVGTGVDVGRSVDLGVGVEAGDGIVATPCTGVEAGEGVGNAALDEVTSVYTSSVEVAWGALQAARNSSDKTTNAANGTTTLTVIFNRTISLKDLNPFAQCPKWQSNSREGGNSQTKPSPGMGNR